MQNPLPVGRPNICNRPAFLSRVNDILESKWLSNNGKYVQEFEQKIAEFVGVKHCICTCNGTIALQLLLSALGLKGEVILPSFTFVATAHAVSWQGITPVFCDIDPLTHNLSPAKVEKAITKNTSAILGVHLWGRQCAIDELSIIASRHSIPLIFDAAHAFACSHSGVKIGNFGVAEVFSFHATKFLNSVEGGAIVTNNDTLAERLRAMKNFGFSRSRYRESSCLGINGKMTEISAAMGLTNLECIDEIVAANRRNYEAYKKGLSDISGTELMEYSSSESNNFQYVVVEIDKGEFGLSRDELIAALAEKNIFAQKYFWPSCHRMEPYLSDPRIRKDSLNNSEEVSELVIVLPTGMSVNQEDVRRVCDLIRNIQCSL